MYFLAFSKDKENGNSKRSQHIPDRPPPPSKGHGSLMNFFKLTPPKRMLPEISCPTVRLFPVGPLAPRCVRSTSTLRTFPLKKKKACKVLWDFFGKLSQMLLFSPPHTNNNNNNKNPGPFPFSMQLTITWRRNKLRTEGTAHLHPTVLFHISNKVLFTLF